MPSPITKADAVEKEMAWLVGDLEKGGLKLGDIDLSALRLALEGAFISGREHSSGVEVADLAESRGQ